MFALTALLIGFTGSFHCVAMCGPIALALSGGRERTFSYLAGRAFYNMGRLVTYILLGALAGSAGKTLMMAGFQNSLSIGIGILMIGSVVVIYYMPGLGKPGILAFRLNGFVRNVFGKVLREKNFYSLFAGGLANGILPCGFVYLAMAGAAATQTTVAGMEYMALFGLGTVPAMMAVSAFGKIAGMKGRRLLNKAAPVMMIALGVLFIYRGMAMQNHSCCHTARPVAEYEKSY